MADYSQHKVYQLKPDTGEVRVIPLGHTCDPVALTVDLSNNCFYVVCREFNSETGGYRSHIRKKTFDGKVDEVIHNETKGKEQCL